ncbi:MAG: hypothetical protein AAFN78_13005 [Pseudomonadota bacterium]
MTKHTSKLTCAATSLAMAMLLAGCSTTPTEEPPAPPKPEAASIGEGTEGSPVMTAAAQNPAAPTAAAPALATVHLPSNDIQCKRMQVTGSHMYKKVCTTKKQRDYIEQNTEEITQSIIQMRRNRK